jgi:signal transduction histidine kinase
MAETIVDTARLGTAAASSGAAGARASRSGLAIGYVLVSLSVSTASMLTHGELGSRLYEAVPAGCVVAILVGVRRFRPTRRAPWLLMAGGQALWLAGDLYWDLYPSLTGQELPAPSPADVLYGLGYPLMIASVALFVRSRREGLRREGWIDAAIVTVVFGILIWELALEAQIAAGVTMAGAVDVAYPVMDVLLVGILARLLFAPGRRTVAFTLVALGLGTVLLADISYAHSVATGWWALEYPQWAAWLLGYTLIGAAALHPSMVRIEGHAGREAPLTRRRAILLAVVASLPLVEFVLGDVAGADDGVADTGVAMLLVVALLVYRLTWLIASVERQSVELGILHRERGLVLDDVTRAVERERARMAAELHDGPVQRLTALAMNAHVGARKMRAGDPDDALAALEEVADGLGDEVGDLRALMSQLHPPVLAERGLLDALRDHAETFAAEHRIRTVVEGSLDHRLPADSEPGLYRIAQEALTNAGRHSRASRIDVDVASLPDRVRVSIRDDGVGFDPSAPTTHNGGRHFGLLAMRERAQILHGTLVIRSSPGQGTTVTVEIPARVGS